MGHFDYQEFEQSHQLVDTSCINVVNVDAYLAEEIFFTCLHIIMHITKHNYCLVSQLETLSSKLKMWETDTPMKREDYKGLSFFSNHKILQLYTLLKGKRIQEIYDEITNCMVDSNTLSNDEIKLKVIIYISCIPCNGFLLYMTHFTSLVVYVHAYYMVMLFYKDVNCKDSFSSK